MRVVSIAAGAILIVGLSLAHADDVDKAKDRARLCAAQATEKQLSDEAMKAFMKACVAGEGPVMAPDEPTKARDRKKHCAIVANSRSLTGADRDAFIKSCLAGNAS